MNKVKAIMKIDVLDLKGEKTGECDLVKELSEGAVNADVLHQVVVAYHANKRRGTASTKTKGEVRGSGKKPWRQKGTGRARVGSVRNPVWRGGGIVFGPKPRDYSQKITKKTKKVALCASLKDRFQSNSVVIIDEINIDTPKTKVFVDLLKKLNLSGEKVLFLVKDVEQNVKLASRNIARLDLKKADEVNAWDVLLHDKLVITKDALDELNERIAKDIKR